MTNQLTAHQLIESWREHLVACEKMCDAALANARRLEDLGLEAAQDTTREYLRYSRSLLDAVDLQSVVSLNTAFAQPGIEKTLAFWSKFCETIASAQREVLQTAGNTAARTAQSELSGIPTADLSAAGEAVSSMMKSYLDACNVGFASAMNLAPDAQAEHKSGRARARKSGADAR